MFCLARRGGRPYIEMDSVSGAFTELNGNVHLFAAAVECHLHCIARSLPVEQHVHVELTRDFLRVNLDNHVSADVDPPHACFRDTIAASNPAGSGRPSPPGSLAKEALFYRHDALLARSASPRRGVRSS